MKKVAIIAGAVLAGAMLGAVISGSVQAAPATPTTPQAAPTPGAGSGYMGRGGMMGGGMMGRGGMMGGEMGMEPEVLALLNMTREQVIAERQAGKSLTQIAEPKGISKDTLVSTILAAKKGDLDELVAAGRLTQDQANQMYQNMQQSVALAVDRTTGGPMWQNGAMPHDADDCPMLENGQPNTQQNGSPRFNGTRPGRGGMMRAPRHRTISAPGLSQARGEGGEHNPRPRCLPHPLPDRT